MKKFTAAMIFILLAAMAAFAVQGSAQQPSTAPQPGMSQPQSQTPQQPPANPSTSPPPLPQQDQAPQPPQTPQTPQTPQSPQSASGNAPTIDDQVKMLAAQLNLTDDQQTKIKGILQDQHDLAMGIVQDQTMSRDQKLEKIHGLRETTINRVRGTLSSDEQRQKFDAMVQGQEQRMHQREQQPPQAPQSPK
jgi:hypothetical protein